MLAAEDPSENYVKLRDFVLSKLCQSLPAFAADKLPLGFSDHMAKEAQEKLKINKVQHRADSFIISVLKHCITNCCFSLQKHARRVYEILRMRVTDMSDEDQAKEYRLEVKRRLFGPYRVRR